MSDNKIVGNRLKNIKMNENQGISSENVRDKLSQDIERLKLVVQNKSLRWDEYSDSDDDALHITEAEDETEPSFTDLNGKHYNGQLSDKNGVKERLFTEEAIQGISQDSMGSVGSVELTNSPEVCLALNREYQEWIRRNLIRIQLVLEHNRRCQREVRLEMQEKSSEKIALTTKKKTMTIYSKPYFKDADGSFPPPNEDTVAKRNLGEFDAFVRPPKLWSTAERNKLRAAVQADRLQKALRPPMNRKELELDRLKIVLPDSTEEKQIMERLDEINKQIKAIRESTDINAVYGDLKDVDSIDWMKIANVDFDGQRTHEACRLFWLNAAHPSIMVSKWTPAEDTKLMELVSKYEGVHWEEISRSLGTNRSAFMCLQRYQTKLNPCLQTGKWTPEEDEFLNDVINNYRTGDSIPWSTVAYFVEGRSREQCARRWEQLHPKTFKKGRWTAEEDNKLIEATRLFGINKWWMIKEFVPGRTSAQCRERWTNTLDQSIQFGQWTYEEDRILWLAVQELGAGHWQRIASEYIPGRTDNMCLQRYRRLLHWFQENRKKVKAKCHSKINQWRSLNQWRKAKEREMKRRRLQRALQRAKVDAMEKEAASALTYVEEVCDDDPEICCIQQTEEKLENVKNVGEEEAMRIDREKGIIIPRPLSRSLKGTMTEIRHLKMKSDIEKRIEKQILSERNKPSNIKTRLEELISEKGTSTFSQPLQEKLQSLSHNDTIRQLIDLSAENKQDPSKITSAFGSALAQVRGRPKRSIEDMEIEHKIALLVSDEVVPGSSLSWTILRPGAKKSEEIEAKIIRLLTNALVFRKGPFAPSVPIPKPPSGGKFAASHSNSNLAKSEAPDHLQSDQSIVVVLKKALIPKASLLLASQAQQKPICRSSTPTSTRNSGTRKIKKKGRNALGRAALVGSQAKIYSMPPLPPSYCTLNAFKTLLLNRSKLMTVCGKFNIPGILPIPVSEKETARKQAVKADDRSKGESENPKETKEDHEHHENTYSQENSSTLADVTTCEENNGLPKVNVEIENQSSNSKEFMCVSEGHSQAMPARSRNKKLSRTIDKTVKHIHPQVVRSKFRSKQIMNAIHASHDYHMMRSRFFSVFLWPAFLSTIPVQEVAPKVCERTTAELTDNDFLSSELSDEDDHDYEFSSDDDWSRKHFRKGYLSSGKTHVYGKWKRKIDRNTTSSANEDHYLPNTIMGKVMKSKDALETYTVPNTTFCDSSQLLPSTQRKKRIYQRKSFEFTEDRRTSRRLAEKRDLMQRTENQETVMALGTQRAQMKLSDSEYDSDSSVSRAKRQRVTDETNHEEKSRNVVSLKSSCISGQNANHLGILSRYVMTSQMNSSAGVENIGNGFLQPANMSSDGLLLPTTVDANGFFKPVILSSDGVVQPVIVNSSEFLDSVIASGGFLQAADVAGACGLYQPPVANMDGNVTDGGSSLNYVLLTQEDITQPLNVDMTVVGSTASQERVNHYSFNETSFQFQSKNMMDSDVSAAAVAAATNTNIESSPKLIVVQQNIKEQGSIRSFDSDSEDFMEHCDDTLSFGAQEINSVKVEAERPFSQVDVAQGLGSIPSITNCFGCTPDDSGHPMRLSNLDVLVQASELLEKCSTMEKENQVIIHEVVPVTDSNTLDKHGTTEGSNSMVSSISSYVSVAGGIEPVAKDEQEMSHSAVCSTLSTNMVSIPVSGLDRETEYGASLSTEDTAGINTKLDSIICPSTCISSVSSYHHDEQEIAQDNIPDEMEIDFEPDGGEQAVLSDGAERSTPTIMLPIDLSSTVGARPCVNSSDPMDAAEYTVENSGVASFKKTLYTSEVSVDSQSSQSTGISLNNNEVNIIPDMSCQGSHDGIEHDHSAQHFAGGMTLAPIDLVKRPNTNSVSSATFQASVVPSSHHHQQQQQQQKNTMPLNLSDLNAFHSAIGNATAAMQQMAVLFSQLVNSFQMPVLNVQSSGLHNLTFPGSSGAIRDTGLHQGAGLEACSSVLPNHGLQFGVGVQSVSGFPQEILQPGTSAGTSAHQIAGTHVNSIPSQPYIEPSLTNNVGTAQVNNNLIAGLLASPLCVQDALARMPPGLIQSNAINLTCNPSALFSQQLLPSLVPQLSGQPQLPVTASNFQPNSLTQPGIDTGPGSVGNFILQQMSSLVSPACLMALSNASVNVHQLQQLTGFPQYMSSSEMQRPVSVSTAPAAIETVFNDQAVLRTEPATDVTPVSHSDTVN